MFNVLEISRLELRILDISQNELSELPSDLRFMSTMVDLRIDANPLKRPPIKLCQKGREHVFKWLRSHAEHTSEIVSENDQIFKRPAENMIDGKRMERRSRTARFNTVSGNESNYISTFDSNRFSREQQKVASPAGCLFDIDERCQLHCHEQQRNPVTVCSNYNTADGITAPKSVNEIVTDKSAAGGELLQEIMQAYDQKVSASSVSQQASRLPHSSTSEYHTSTELALLFPCSSTISSTVITPTTNSCLSSTGQRPQAIVPPMITITEQFAAISLEDDVKKCLGQNNKQSVIDNNNTYGWKPISNNHEYNQCSLINCHSTINDSGTTKTSSDANVMNCTSNIINNNAMNTAYAADGVIKMIDDLSTTVTDSDSVIVTNLENASKRSLELPSTIRNQQILLPVLENLNPSDNSSDHNLASTTVSTVAYISSLTADTSASETTTCSIASSDAVISSVKVPLVSVKNAHVSASNKSSCSSRSSASNQPSTSSQNVTAKLHATRSIRSSSSRVNGIVSSTTKYINRSGSGQAPRTKSSHSPRISTKISYSTSTNNSGIVENMRKVIEDRLNLTLPSDRSQLAASLSDGVKLCNFANQIRTKAVSSLFTPVAKDLQLSPPKCRRNVDNFLAACRRIGVPEVNFSNFDLEYFLVNLYTNQILR
ncbi:unnamed protein product [Thelazia callipaeda]|uniref:Calponin-homology (CH) domain-containing protein n=1 Tax=Thelazia callipaeda TaxID=103827 RepID=A0A0N5CK48_THECL|nr:unnamed protein product [Thelazia callipaeda]